MIVGLQAVSVSVKQTKADTKTESIKGWRIETQERSARLIAPCFCYFPVGLGVLTGV
jgi:hypothetical protein